MKREFGQTGQCKAFEVAASASSSVLCRGHANGLGHVMHHATSHSAAMYINVPKCGSNHVKRALPQVRGDGVDHVETAGFGEEMCDLDGETTFCLVFGVKKEEHSMPQLSISLLRPIFYYSFVRDSLDRFMSALYELLHRGRVDGTPWGNVGISPFDAGENAAKMEGAVLRAEALVAFMESGGRVDEHITAHTVYFQKPRVGGEYVQQHENVHDDIVNRPQDFEMLSLDYFGQTQCLSEGLADVVRAVNRSDSPIFRHDSIDIIDKLSPANAQPEETKHLFWAAMNRTLRQRVCDLYWVDYCCLKLPVPAECEIKSCLA